MFTEEAGDAICALLAEGLSLRKSAKAIGVSAATVLNWVDANAAFNEQYTCARARGYQLLADEILEIADSSKRDLDEEGKPDSEAVARDRLRVDSRKWMLSKMLPKVYGDKLDLNHSGRIATQREMTEEELVSIATAGRV